MKFIADVMLGRLAKKLRLLGHDVLYDPVLDDNEAIRISLEQNRIILTRDAELAKRPLARNHLFIRDDNPDRQLQQMLAFLSASSPARQTFPLTRCSLCNDMLVRIPKKEVRDSVPAYVYNKYRKFLQCRQCGRIYWTGTHTARMRLSGTELRDAEKKR